MNYVLDPINDYSCYLLGKLFGNILVLPVLFTILQIPYCDLIICKLCDCQVFYSTGLTCIG